MGNCPKVPILLTDIFQGIDLSCTEKGRFSISFFFFFFPRLSSSEKVAQNLQSTCIGIHLTTVGSFRIRMSGLG